MVPVPCEDVARVFTGVVCSRGLGENSQGWTVQLQEDVDYYELMGYDYVLDLISEIEIAPGFPAGTAYCLVSVDRSKERLHHRRHGHAEGSVFFFTPCRLLVYGMPHEITLVFLITSSNTTGKYHLIFLNLRVHSLIFCNVSIVSNFVSFFFIRSFH